jgi:ubiquinone/menaquinone biosynthesis C-methylase UbiE
MTDSVAKYTEEFIARVFALRPQSVLDVGCGQGDFIAQAQSRDILAAGVDANPERVAAAQQRGLDVQQADAEHLPFADGAFEWCICMRSAHHFGDLRGGLREALRVATEGVLIYDPWYDESVPSQATAAALDRWYKRTDRAQGHTNNGPLTAADFIAALPSGKMFQVDATYRLALQSVDLAEAEAESREYTAHNGPHTDQHAFDAELDSILQDAQRTGLSEAAALFVSIRKIAR